MEMIKKNWDKKGKACIVLSQESLAGTAQKLEYMLFLPGIKGFLTENHPIRGKTPLKVLLSVEKETARIRKTKIVRDLLLIASFMPSMTKITAIHESKKIPKKCVDFPVFRDYLRSKGVIWNIRSYNS